MKTFDPILWAVAGLGAGAFVAGAILSIMGALAFGLRI